MLIAKTLVLILALTMPILRNTKFLLLDEHAPQSAPKIVREVLSSIRKLRDLLRIVWSL